MAAPRPSKTHIGNHALKPETADTKTFSLVGGSPSDLQQYVNSKVEITGTIDPNANRSSAGAPSTGISAFFTCPTSYSSTSTMSLGTKTSASIN